MKQFFKFLLASTLGFFISIFILVILLIGMVTAIIASDSSKTESITSNTILKVDFKSAIYDRSPKTPVNIFGSNPFDQMAAPGLNEIIENINKAANDKNIEGILLTSGILPAGMATIEEIRNALIEFKKSGKFIYAYSEVYTQKGYYLCSVADKIFLNPEGGMEFKGLAGQVIFFKGLLDKLDVKMEILRGPNNKYKSAVEPFMKDKMSDSNRAQTKAYLTSLWNHLLNTISQSRKISIEELNNIADQMSIATPQDAIQFKLVDQLAYWDEVAEQLKELTNQEKEKKPRFVSLKKYTNILTDKSQHSRDKIAVIYAQGSIKGGEGDDTTIGSDRLSQAIRKARKDKKVKAVVLRVNSPGGSALASDVIWRELELCKKEKPLVASFGNLAASGGYYIACGAHTIYAQPTTLTGSIGVFGMIPNISGLLNNKLGITYDHVNTNQHSDFYNGLRPMSEEEIAFINKGIVRVYNTFISHVAEGRGMTTSGVDSIAQGRVWSGQDAIAIGLVDKIGSLEDAIKEAAALANLESYRIKELPQQKDPFIQLMEQLSGESIAKIALQKELGENYMLYNSIQEINNMKGPQVRLPYLININ